MQIDLKGQGFCVRKTLTEHVQCVPLGNKPLVKRQHDLEGKLIKITVFLFDFLLYTKITWHF